MYGGLYYGPQARPWVQKSTPWAPTPPYEGNTIALQTSMTPFKAGDFDPVGMQANLPEPHYLADWSGPGLGDWFSNLTNEIAGAAGNIRPGMALQSPYMRGNHVAALQAVLIGMGYNVGAQGDDGVYGPGTASAVVQFQLSKGLPQTGNVDLDTANAMNRAIAVKKGFDAIPPPQQMGPPPSIAPAPAPIGLTGSKGGMSPAVIVGVAALMAVTLYAALRR
jgi:hypothetical protein